MNSGRTLIWFSCGAASAVAAKLTLGENPEAEPVYCDTGGEHPDNERFLLDCERWFGRTVTRIKSEKYDDVWDVWNKRRYLAGIDGAVCTVEMKIAPRLLFQRPHDYHVFGYTSEECSRADRLRENYPELTIDTPLIRRGIDKAACLALIESAGIALPAMYLLGFQNNNCIPCVKATSPAYWALVRRRFPDKFERMATLSRELGVRLARVDNERVFIDEIPADQAVSNPIQPACDFLCHLVEEDISTWRPLPEAPRDESEGTK
jgi:hypothetical protein